MSQFLFDQQLSEAVRLDSSLHLSNSIIRQSLKPVNFNGPVSLNRSRSASRLSPSLTSAGMCSATGNKPLARSKSPARRTKTPTRCGSSVGQQPAALTRNGSNGCDRFIPNRSTTDLEYAQHSLGINDTQGVEESMTASQQDRKKMMGENLNCPDQDNTRILSFKTKAPAPREGHLNNMKVLYSSGKPSAPKAANNRSVPTSPDKILDAPDMLNDFYLHLMDWSSLNHMAVALGAGVYIWNAADGNIVQLCEQEEDYVSCVSWISQGNVLAVGDSLGRVQLWDVASSKLIRSMTGHTDRVGCLDWNQHLLASGGRGGEVHIHDVRVASHQVASLLGHSQEVCGLDWSVDGKSLASGGNDNTVILWDTTVNIPVHTITSHQSAVKAVSWCPWQSGMLATAGGTVDRTIRLWNTSGGNLTQLHHLDTGSQVSSIVWNSEYRELVTGHGFSHNQLTVWRYQASGLTKVSDLTGHTSRVLLLATSPDNSTVASVAADETIRLWKIWPVNRENKTSKKSSKSHPVSMLTQSIR